MRKISALLLSMLLLTGCAALAQNLPDADQSAEEAAVEQAEPENAVLVCEWPEYDVSASGVTFIFTNPLDEPFYTGMNYELQAKDAFGLWKTVPVIENGGWPAVELVVEPEMSRAFTLSFSFYDYDFRPGVYRVLKDGYSAEFTLTDGAAISAETPYGFAPLEELPEKNFSTENCIVFVDSRLGSGMEPMKAFLEKVSLEMDCQLRSVERASNGASAVIDIIYEDGRFLRRGLTDGDIAEKFFSYIITDGTNLYLSNAADWDTAADHAQNSCVDQSAFCLLPQGCADAELVSAVEDMTATRLANNITRYKVWSQDGTMFASLTETPTTLSMGGLGYGTVVDLRDYDGLETAILDIAWQEDGSVLLTCDTNTGEKSILRAALKQGPLHITITSP